MNCIVFEAQKIAPIFISRSVSGNISIVHKLTHFIVLIYLFGIFVGNFDIYFAGIKLRLVLHEDFAINLFIFFIFCSFFFLMRKR